MFKRIVFASFVLLFVYGAAGAAYPAYGVCASYVGLKKCSGSYSDPVVLSARDNPAGYNKPLQCVPGRWADFPSACTGGFGPYVSRVQFSNCINDSGLRGGHKSLWSGCTLDVAPPINPTVGAGPTDVPIPTDVPSPTPNGEEENPTDAPVPSPTGGDGEGGEARAVVVEACSDIEPTGTLAPTLPPISISCPASGDYNGNGRIDGSDYDDWLKDYKSRNSTLACFEYWRRAMFSFGGARPPALPPADTPIPSSVAAVPSLTSIPEADPDPTTEPVPEPTPEDSGNTCAPPNSCTFWLNCTWARWQRGVGGCGNLEVCCAPAEGSSGGGEGSGGGGPSATPKPAEDENGGGGDSGGAPKCAEPEGYCDPKEGDSCSGKACSIKACNSNKRCVPRTVYVPKRCAEGGVQYSCCCPGDSCSTSNDCR